MKQVINNKLYDTDKARFLCERWSAMAENDELYVTKNGSFFFRRQNPVSKEIYLCPVKKDGIAELLAKRNTDAYIEFFGKVEEA